MFSTRIVSMATLIQIPSAAFILTYLGACAAGIKLLKDSKFGMVISIISFLMSAIILLFTKWTIFYPIVITIVWLTYMRITKRPIKIAEHFNKGNK